MKLPSGQIVFVTRARKIVPERLKAQSELRASSAVDMVIEQPVYEAEQLVLEEAPMQRWHRPLTIERVGLMLAELASALPKETPLEPVLRLTSQLFNEPPASPKELREMIEGVVPSLDTAIKDCYLKVVSNYLFPL